MGDLFNQLSLTATKFMFVPTFRGSFATKFLTTARTATLNLGFVIVFSQKNVFHDFRE